jgi:hypothetical protein
MTHERDTDDLDAQVEVVLEHGRRLRERQRKAVDGDVDNLMLKAMNAAFDEVDREYRKATTKYEVKVFGC